MIHVAIDLVYSIFKQRLEQQEPLGEISALSGEFL